MALIIAALMAWKRYILFVTVIMNLIGNTAMIFLVNLDEKLPLTSRLGDFGLQQLTVVSRNSRINSSVSTADILALQQSEKGSLDSAFKYSRSVSPCSMSILIRIKYAKAQ